MQRSVRSMIGSPWVALCVGVAVFAYAAATRSALDSAEERGDRWARDEQAREGLEKEIAQADSKLTAARGAEDEARAVLRDDLLFLRGIDTLQETRPDGLWMEGWSWSTVFPPDGPSYDILVTGQVRQASLEAATETWRGWTSRITAARSWEVRVTPPNGPDWLPGQMPGMFRFHARFRVQRGR